MSVHAAWLCALLLANLARAQAPRVAVESVGFTVSDLDAAQRFFTTVLDFEVTAEHEAEGDAHERLEGVFALHVREATLRLGDESLVLTEFLAPRGRAIPADSRSNDRWFQHVAIIVRDIDEAYARLRAHEVTHVSPSPQTLPAWNEQAGGIRAFYFQDPDGHPLEVLWFPPGKGDARWQRRDRLFVGIDHTAIAVADTEKSLAFWRDALGLRVVGTSENWGVEQERLNAVFGAHLRITTLRGDAGPGVELLEYLAPTNGRERPRDANGSDLLTWRTTLRIAALDANALDALRAHGGTLVSPGIVACREHDARCEPAATVGDPDGHVVRLVGARDARD